MSDDIVTRLRGDALGCFSIKGHYPLADEAADEITKLRAELAAERRDHEATKTGHSLAMKRAAEEAREAHTNLAAKNENLRDMMFRAYQEGWNSSLSYVGEDDMIDAWEESAAKARIDAFLEGE